MGWSDALRLATNGIKISAMPQTSRSLLERLRTQPDHAASAQLVEDKHRMQAREELALRSVQNRAEFKRRYGPRAT
jgi:hypothetical protein